MKTQILTVSKNNIEKAARALSENKLVAFPTETVYGLGANALSEEAVKKIFIAKGRPSDNPLIVHISSINILEKLVAEIPLKAKKLMKNFWPGPLTIIFKRKNTVPKIVSAGLETVAIRMPSHKVALNLIEKSKVPVAAPSANLSTKPSPTKAEHVIQDLDNRVDVIIKACKVDVGLESTVIDLTEKTPVILRPGKITREEIEEIIGKVDIKSKNGKEAKSPGMKYKHYSPNAKVILLPRKKMKEIRSHYRGKKVGTITNKSSLEDFGKNIFSKFREMDKREFEIILVELVPEDGLGAAIMNRLKKAASEIILN